MSERKTWPNAIHPESRAAAVALLRRAADHLEAGEFPVVVVGLMTPTKADFSLCGSWTDAQAYLLVKMLEVLETEAPPSLPEGVALRSFQLWNDEAADDE